MLLNNDIDVIAPGWLTEMVSHAIRPDVGAVGAKLLYPDGTVQHAGIALGPAGAAWHLMRRAARDDPGYLGQLALTRTVSAVTGACMALRRAVFLEVGGIEESRCASPTTTWIFACGSASGLPRRVRSARRAVSPGSGEPGPGRRAREAAPGAGGAGIHGPALGGAGGPDPFLNPNLCVVNERLALRPLQE